MQNSRRPCSDPQDSRLVNLKDPLDTYCVAKIRPEKSRSEVTVASAALVDHSPTSVNISTSPTTPPEVRSQPVRRESGINAAKLLQLQRSLLSQTDLGPIEDLHTVVGDLRRRNKRLKRRLQRYTNDSIPLPERMLFEMKIFGLNLHQRHILLDILLGFADGLLQEVPELAVYTTGSERTDEQGERVDHYAILRGQP